MKTQLDALKTSERKARLDGFKTKVVNVPAGFSDKVIAVAEKLADVSNCEFSDKSGQKSTVSALDAFADILSAGFNDKNALERSIYQPEDDFADKGGKEKSASWGDVMAKF